MDSWLDMSIDALRAASKLLEEGHYRSSTSRAYYSAYCVVTSALISGGAQFTRGWHNPRHEAVDGHLLSRGFLGHLHDRQRLDLRKSWLALLASRVDADYRPTATVSRQQARDALRDARVVLGYVS
ncbi:MAG: HEPN domain-containing protein [Armatimonadia bacterium]|nr:HEPN domain-containing protein [Armatimonadia bacterium]